MVYLQSVEWTGPRDRSTDSCDKYGTEILVTSAPGRGNMSPHPEIVNGWLGTTNDWRRDAHGEFETVEAALAAAAEQFGTLYEPSDAQDDDDTLAVRYDRERAAAYYDASDWLNSARTELLRELQAGKSVEQMTAELEAEAAAQVEHDCPAGVILHGTESYLRELLDEAA